MNPKLKLNNKDKLVLFADLATMLGAGIPILEAIESLASDAKGNLHKVLIELRRSLNNGENLARAMSRFPRAFEPVTVNLIRAAESGGTLEETLQDIVRTTKKQAAFSTSLKTAMIYPAFVMTIFTGIIILLLTFVVPRLGQVFKAMHTKVPWATQQLMNASGFFLAHWPFIVCGIIVTIILIATFVSHYKRTIIRWILSLPGLSHLGITIDLARLTRSLALLLKAGVPLEEALDLTKHTLSKKETVAVVEQMELSMSAGKPLATGLRDTDGVVPVMMARSMETAEMSGTLEQTMQSLAEHFDEQSEEKLKVISSLIEPVMILTAGLLVGSLMICVIAPIYNITSHFKPAGM